MAACSNSTHPDSVDLYRRLAGNRPHLRRYLMTRLRSASQPQHLDWLGFQACAVPRVCSAGARRPAVGAEVGPRRWC
eukprot:14050688-Alexandrium_andersonii.AAC.1